MKSVYTALMTLVLGMLLAGSALAAGDADAGKAKVAGCAACHGDNGNSQAPVNPKLAGQGEKYLLKQLQDIQSGDREVALMAGQLDNFGDNDLADIAAYYASQTQTKSATEAKWVELGKEMYRNGNHERGIPSCTGCHGPAGQGNSPAGYPMIAGQHADYIASQLRSFSVGDRTNDGEGMTMRAIAERMNENEIKAVASFVAGLRQ